MWLAGFLWLCSLHPQAKVCYFCQSSELTSSPSAPPCPLSGYQDSLFELPPDEKLPCAADALLLFCIDISGSMSMTSQVNTSGLTPIRLLFVTIHKSEPQCFLNVRSLSFQGVRGRAGCPQIPSTSEFLSFFQVKGEVHQKMKIQSLSAHSCVSGKSGDVKTFLECHSKTASQHSPKHLRQIATKTQKQSKNIY